MHHIVQGGGYSGDELSEDMLRIEEDDVTEEMADMTLNGKYRASISLGLAPRYLI